MTNEEFTGWRKASYSGQGGGCIEVAAGWRKASYSQEGGSCIEVAAERSVVGVRDTKQHGRGPVLEFPEAAWRAFIAGTRTVRPPREHG